MQTAQPGILAPLPPLARYLSFTLGETGRAADALRALRDAVDGERSVVGIGQTLVAALGANVAGLAAFPAITAPGLAVAHAPEVLWIWLRGDDHGELLHRSRRLARLLAPAFVLDSIVDAFKYADGRDLSGFEDGTENPTGDAALAAATVGEGSSLAASSFVAVQRWQHDFARFETMSGDARDHAVGRRQSDNEELDDAPPSAHVKRTAQESFNPEAFVLRRSMPWVAGNEGGLVFVAFGASFAAFEAQLQRMTGREDGIVDALFSFTQPLDGAYFWCPALEDGKLDLSPLGI